MNEKRITIVYCICLFSFTAPGYTAAPEYEVKIEHEMAPLIAPPEDEELPGLEDIEEVMQQRKESAIQLLKYLFEAFADNPKARSIIRQIFIDSLDKKNVRAHEQAHQMLANLHEGNLQGAMYDVQTYPKKQPPRAENVTIDDITNLVVDGKSVLLELVDHDTYQFLEEPASPQTEKIAGRIPTRRKAANQLMAPLFTAVFYDSAINRNIRKMMEKAAESMRDGGHVVALLDLLYKNELQTAIEYARETHGGSRAILGVHDFTFDQFKVAPYQQTLSLVVASEDAFFLDPVVKKQVKTMDDAVSALLQSVEKMIAERPNAVVLQLQLLQQRNELEQRIEPQMEVHKERTSRVGRSVIEQKEKLALAEKERQRQRGAVELIQPEITAEITASRDRARLLDQVRQREAKPRELEEALRQAALHEARVREFEEAVRQVEVKE